MQPIQPMVRRPPSQTAVTIPASNPSSPEPANNVLHGAGAPEHVDILGPVPFNGNQAYSGMHAPPLPEAALLQRPVQDAIQRAQAAVVRPMQSFVSNA